MRKIIVGAQTSLDGVMQGPGGPKEDPTKDFRFGGWAMPFFAEPGAGEEINRLFSESFDLLLGRKTYEIFAAFWPYYDENAPDGGIATAFKDINKYVVSASGDVDTAWNGTVLLRDVEAVKQLKQEDGPNLVTQGSTELVHALLAADLVDELSIVMMPIVLGQGKKLFADGSAAHSWKLTRSNTARNGVFTAHYVRGGDIRTSDTAMETPSARELARQERMSREG